MVVNFIEIAIADGTGKTLYKSAFATSLAITTTNAEAIAQAARARWKIENGSFNVLKNNGYCLEHNFGHGRDRLAMLFAAMNLLAFAFHCVCDIFERQWQDARTAMGSRARFFMHLHTITAYLVFPNWDVFLQTIITSEPPPELLKLRSQAQS